MDRRKDKRLSVDYNKIRYQKMISEYLTGEIIDVNAGGIKMKFNPGIETFNVQDGIMLELPKKNGNKFTAIGRISWVNRNKGEVGIEIIIMK